ncbi:Helix-turn-helix domain-containing protein [Draconibacterium orientale]|uniref:DNA-binding protein n=1 Tax=Draconibacterium orientale TaxID=1168034 RepID=X5D7K4_9BACT|nr:helix-turn-helix domain-containing protein [Draconibacterium orientale]AHW58668.1 DNA-binding protein [Draconibacterium orientale]SET12283.1 Helix-turn-helix domain-containing protein [Draconibacterium orientale]
MRYFKSKHSLIRFVLRELLRHDFKGKGIREKFNYQFRNSNKKYSSIDEMIDELKQNNLLFEIQQMSEEAEYSFDFAGYVLLHSQLVKLLAGDENLNNDILRFKLLTVNQTCDFLQLSRPSVYKLLKDGDIPQVEIMGQKRVQMNDLLSFISEKKKA